MTTPTQPIHLETERLVLRELRLEDWPGARDLDSDPEVVRYQSNDVLDEAGTRQYLEKSVREAGQAPRTVFDLAVCLRGDDRYVGRVGLKIDRRAHV